MITFGGKRHNNICKHTDSERGDIIFETSLGCFYKLTETCLHWLLSATVFVIANLIAISGWLFVLISMMVYRTVNCCGQKN